MMKMTMLCAALMAPSAWAAEPELRVHALTAHVGPSESAAERPSQPTVFEWTPLATLPDGSQRGRFRVSVEREAGRGPLAKSGVATLRPGEPWATVAASHGLAVKAALASEAPAFDPSAPENALPVEPTELR